MYMASLHLAQEIFKLIYPVGSIYLSTSTTNPSTYFGGTWERIKGRFLLGADDSTYKIGGTGGEASHVLSVAELPNHDHEVDIGSFANKGTENWNAIYNGHISQSRDQNTRYKTRNTGGNQPHNNMPPYLAVYIWKRTA